jgi:hypothetical protein
VKTIEGRLAFLEGRVVEHAQTFITLRDAFTSLERRMDERFTTLDDKVDRNAAEIRTQMSRDFRWTIGIQVTMFATLVAALLGGVLGR